MNEKINRKFKEINKQLSGRNDLVDLFKESWKKTSENNKNIQEFLEIKIKEIFDLDYGEFTISIGEGEICITVWNELDNEDIMKLDTILGIKSKIIHEDEFIHLKYELNRVSLN
ncbi:hypothetical protein [uncultured Methanobrevibacter sp.]|uniref:hypothetical protein n=1 Tax=uncultured Methanobrevibacter sp. TaxID=253161 RepID=UPI00320A3FF0